MSQPTEGGATRAETPPPDPKDASADQATRLVRDVLGIANGQADVATVQQGITR